MAHVEVFKFRAQPGKRQKVIETFDRWGREQRPKGFERSVLVSNLDDPDEFYALVRFDTTESYKANSDRPETDQWFRSLRENLVAEPEWFGGKLELAVDA
jgi:heme-degrading monooxygenase HmoA